MERSFEDIKEALNLWQNGQFNVSHEEQERIIANAKEYGITIEFVYNGEDYYYVPIPSEDNAMLDDEAISNLQAGKSGCAGTVGSGSSAATVSTFGTSTVGTLGSASTAGTTASVAPIDNSEEHFVDVLKDTAGELVDYVLPVKS